MIIRGALMDLPCICVRKKKKKASGIFRTNRAKNRQKYGNIKEIEKYLL